MKRICTICARGGSKGVKGKNTRLLLGKPLIAYTIEQAKASALFDVIAVSSDADYILDAAKEFGVDWLVRRPDELASDLAAKLPAIRHCVQQVEAGCGFCFETIVDLDATAPLRSVADIRDCVFMLENSMASNVITAAPARRSPYFNLVETDENGRVKLSKELPHAIARRQDSPKCYDMNASIYVWNRSTLFDGKGLFNEGTMLHVMPEERSVDIDSELDFRIVEMLMQKVGNHE